MNVDRDRDRRRSGSREGREVRRRSPSDSTDRPRRDRRSRSRDRNVDHASKNSRHDHDRRRRDDYSNRGHQERDSSRRNPKEPSVSDASAVWGNAAAELDEKSEEPTQEVVKANFGITGALAKDKNTGNVYNGVVLKWSEPLDAAKPDRNWRCYVFQGEALVDTLHLHRQSAYLFGRDEKVADVKVLNPSCSKQHAVIQFRRTPTVIREATEMDEAVVRKIVKPYLMDLESTNKTFLNGQAVEPSRYIELRAKDILKFGESSKEYVLVCDK